MAFGAEAPKSTRMTLLFFATKSVVTFLRGLVTSLGAQLVKDPIPSIPFRARGYFMVAGAGFEPAASGL